MPIDLNRVYQEPMAQEARQRALQIDPSQRAVVNEGEILAPFIKDEIEKKYASEQRGIDKKFMIEKLQFDKQRRLDELAMKRRELRQAKQQMPINTALSAANLGLSYYGNQQENQRLKERQAKQDEFMNLMTETYRTSGPEFTAAVDQLTKAGHPPEIATKKVAADSMANFLNIDNPNPKPLNFGASNWLAYILSEAGIDQAPGPIKQGGR